MVVILCCWIYFAWMAPLALPTASIRLISPHTYHTFHASMCDNFCFTCNVRSCLFPSSLLLQRLIDFLYRMSSFFSLESYDFVFFFLLISSSTPWPYDFRAFCLPVVYLLYVIFMFFCCCRRLHFLGFLRLMW